MSPGGNESLRGSPSIGVDDGERRRGKCDGPIKLRSLGRVNNGMKKQISQKSHVAADIYSVTVQGMIEKNKTNKGKS